MPNAPTRSKNRKFVLRYYWCLNNYRYLVQIAIKLSTLGKQAWYKDDSDVGPVVGVLGWAGKWWQVGAAVPKIYTHKIIFKLFYSINSTIINVVRYIGRHFWGKIIFIPFWIQLHPLTSLKISCSPLLEGGKVTLRPSGCKVTLRPSGCKVTLRPSGCKVTFQYNTNNYIYYEMYIKIV